MEQVVILSAKRTPMGAFQGEFTSLSATTLGGAAIKAAVQESGVDHVDEVMMGCVLPAGLGQAPARQASLAGGISKSVPTTTINKVCGSGMRAVMMASDQLRLGQGQVMVAGGMESMTNAPYLLPKARGGFRMGHGEVKDHMFMDGLENAYDHNLMGHFAEETAKTYGFTREEQDNFARMSGERALAAESAGSFKNEIVPVEVTTREGSFNVARDESPTKIKFDKIPTLRPAFAKDGTVTAANSSSISDGAAALVLTTQSYADQKGLKPRAIIRGYTSHAHEPEWFTTAPVGALTNLLAQVGWSVEDVDLFEINEAFAVVPMAAMRDLKIPHDKVNIHGGACALGHPLGASGARIIATLLNALEVKGLSKGVASLCIGGGEATAIAIERTS